MYRTTLSVVAALWMGPRCLPMMPLAPHWGPFMHCAVFSDFVVLHGSDVAGMPSTGPCTVTGAAPLGEPPSLAFIGSVRR